VTVLGANPSRPTGSLGQRQKPKEAKSKKRNFLLCYVQELSTFS